MEPVRIRCTLRKTVAPLSDWAASLASGGLQIIGGPTDTSRITSLPAVTA